MLIAVIIENRFNVSDIIERHMKFLPGWGVKHIKEDVKSQMDYNYLLANPEFWDRLIAFERVLIFQHDSEILRLGVDEFLKWDFIGAPFWFQEFGGNGGISLRNPRVMKDICQRSPYKQSMGNEDVYFSNIMHSTINDESQLSDNWYKRKYNLAPVRICEKFGVETLFKLGTWSAHAIDQHLTKDECNQIRTQYIGKPENTHITA